MTTRQCVCCANCTVNVYFYTCTSFTCTNYRVLLMLEITGWLFLGLFTGCLFYSHWVGVIRFNAPFLKGRDKMRVKRSMFKLFEVVATDRVVVKRGSIKARKIVESQFELGLKPNWSMLELISISDEYVFDVVLSSKNWTFQLMIWATWKCRIRDVIISNKKHFARELVFTVRNKVQNSLIQN